MNPILQQFSSFFPIQWLQILAILAFTGCTVSSEIIPNKHGLMLIENAKQYDASIKNNPGQALVDLSSLGSTLTFDLRYCTDDNFVGQKLYPPLQTTYLRKDAAEALQKAVQNLKSKGYGLLIWDGYRPYSVTQKMWEIVPDSRYAADPKFGSGHNRGISIDLSLVDLTSGTPLDMGTGFDHFSDTAHISFKNLPDTILQNRKILQEAMEDAGFKVLETEWWHFYLPDSKSYPLMNLSFKQIEKNILRR